MSLLLDTDQPERWESSELRAYLAEHHVPAPTHLNHEQLADLVRQTEGGTAPNQHYFEAGTDSGTYSSWSDSSLRAYLLEHGIISPASKREELILLAKQHASSASNTATGVIAQATDSASSVASAVSSVGSAAASQASETLSSAW